MLSSPMACLETVENRLKRLQEKKNVDADTRQDIAALQELQTQLKPIKSSDFSKYQQLLERV